MIRDVRDFIIMGFVIYLTALIIWARTSPENIGQWKARMDVAYDQIWSEYVADCDCTEEYQ